MRITLFIKSILLLGIFGIAMLADRRQSPRTVLAAGGNRCTDHCADRYKIAKDGCRVIPFKTERKICERRAKEVKEDCKHRCR
jgi:hypothetical protein